MEYLIIGSVIVILVFIVIQYLNKIKSKSEIETILPVVGVFTDHIFAWPLFLDVASRIYASAREAHAARARLSAATPRPRTCPPPAGYPLQSVAGS